MKFKFSLLFLVPVLLTSCSGLPEIEYDVALDMVKSSYKYLKELNNIPYELIMLNEFKNGTGTYDKKRQIGLRTNDNIAYEYNFITDQSSDGVESQDWAYILNENDTKYTIFATYNKKALTDNKTYYKYKTDDSKYIDKDYARKLAQKEFIDKLTVFQIYMEEYSSTTKAYSDRSNFVEIKIEFTVQDVKSVYFMRLEDNLIYQYNIEKYQNSSNELIDIETYEFHYDPVGIELPNLEEYRLVNE